MVYRATRTRYIARRYVTLGAIHYTLYGNQKAAALSEGLGSLIGSCLAIPRSGARKLQVHVV